MAVEPVPGAPAATANLPDGTALVVADYHAGIEVGLRREGVELRSNAASRRESLCSLLDRTGADRLVVLGDLADDIGAPTGEEREELLDLFGAVADRVPVTVVKGNHDGEVEGVLDEAAAGAAHPIDLTPGHGVRLGEVGFAHGHTWPSPDVLAAETVCTAHEHPVVRLEDDVGGHRVERVWLRGRLDSAPFADHWQAHLESDAALVVFPAFNDLSGGTWVNVDEQSFLSPFLPAGLAEGEAYLLDGTRLGRYDAL